MVDDQTIISIAARYGLPPTMLKAAMAQGQGVPDHAASTAGFSQDELTASPVLQVEVAARALQQSFRTEGSWDKALAMYYSGNPDVAPGSPGVSLAMSTLGLSAIDPMLGMDNYPGQLDSAMFQSLGSLWKPFATQGGIISHDQIQSFYNRATEIVGGVHGSSQAGPPGRTGGQFSSIGTSDPNLVGGRSYSAGQCTALAANVLTWIPEYAGDAYNWVNSVPSKVPGAQVVGTPAAGAAVVWGAGQGGAAGAGHVGVVVGVNPDGSVQVLQQNWPEGSGPNISTLPKSEAGQLAYILPPPGQAALSQAQATVAAQQVAMGAPVDVSQAKAEVGPKPTPAPGQEAPPPPSVDPTEVAKFKNQANAAGIHDPSLFGPNTEFLSNLTQQLMGRPPTMAEMAETQGMTDQQIRQWVLAQPHGIYPQHTAGDMKTMTDKASLFSTTMAGRMPHAGEVSRLISLNASASDLKAYFGDQTQQMPFQDAQALQQQQQQQMQGPQKPGAAQGRSIQQS